MTKKILLGVDVTTDCRWADGGSIVARTHRFRFMSVAFLLGINLILLGTVSAQNRVVNGGFDQNIAGWTPFSDPGANVSAVWSSNDAAGETGSGSVEVRDLNPGSGGAASVLQQCVALNDMPVNLPWTISSQVELEGKLYVRTYISFSEHPNDQCSGGTLGPGLTRAINFSDPLWQTASGDYVLQAPSVGSILITLRIERPPGSNTGGFARFDNIELGAFEDDLFSDRFESP
jgi:hypothetical protein